MNDREEKKKWTTLRKIAAPQAATPQPEEKKEKKKIVLKGVEKVLIPKTESAAKTEPPKEPEVAKVAEPAVAPRVVEPRVLVLHGMSSTHRLIKESLETFTNAKVVATSDPLYAFEKALQLPFTFFIIGFELETLSGPFFYELVARAYEFGGKERRISPPVIFVREKGDPQFPDEMKRDARVKSLISKPLHIERLLQTVSGMVERVDPLSSPGDRK